VPRLQPTGLKKNNSANRRCATARYLLTTTADEFIPLTYILFAIYFENYSRGSRTVIVLHTFSNRILMHYLRHASQTLVALCFHLFRESLRYCAVMRRRSKKRQFRNIILYLNVPLFKHTHTHTHTYSPNIMRVS
jgi:hypothetical protein